jgi:hypothetical protein
VVGDPVLLRAAIENLIDNAVNRGRGIWQQSARAPVLREGQKRESIYASSEFIWRIPVRWRNS